MFDGINQPGWGPVRFFLYFLPLSGFVFSGLCSLATTGNILACVKWRLLPAPFPCFTAHGRSFFYYFFFVRHLRFRIWNTPTFVFSLSPLFFNFFFCPVLFLFFFFFPVSNASSFFSSSPPWAPLCQKMPLGLYVSLSAPGSMNPSVISCSQPPSMVSSLYFFSSFFCFVGEGPLTVFLVFPPFEWFAFFRFPIVFFFFFYPGTSSLRASTKGLPLAFPLPPSPRQILAVYFGVPTYISASWPGCW